MDWRSTCKATFLKFSIKFELKEQLFNGVEGLMVPNEEDDRSSGGMEDSIESKEGRLCPFTVSGEDSVNEMLIL